MNRRRNRRRLQELLRELFQFDASELDFGIYRILNQRREEIDRFIERDLLEAVEEELERLAASEREELEEALAEQREELGEGAFEEDGSLKEGVEATNAGQRYQQLAAELEAAEVAEETEARIFNDLYRFFSRYYREGDFLTERRYSPREPKYAVPYNGEEVLLHWANRDQYYVKTTERFADYRFQVGDQAVIFRLQSAQTAQDDVQGESRHFVLVDGEPLRLGDGSAGLEVRFAYRVLSEEEEQQVLDWYNADRSKSDQRKRLDRSIVVDVLKDQILERLEELGATELRAELAVPKQEGQDRSWLETHLDRYTARHEMDYFVHKDLGGFLRRELDFFLKNEVLELDDFSDSPGTEAFEQATLRMQVIRSIADRVIEFLAQIEDFQKRLFEKKKFVVDTQYCVTLDRVPEKLYGEVLANEQQLDAWREMYALDEWDKDLFQQDEEIDRAFMEAHPYLMIDTAHFEQSFTDRLLASFDDLEEATDGLLIHGENLQALNLLYEKYRHNIDCIYIDPPYNTGNDDFVFKDNYRHSSWLSMMTDRVSLARAFLPDDAAFFATIDDNEFHRFRALLGEIFGDRDFVTSVAWQKKVSPSNDATWFSSDHDHVFVAAKDKSRWTPNRLPRSEEQKKYYTNPDDDPRGPWNSVAYTCNKSRQERPNLYYPITNPNTGEEIWPKETAVWAFSQERHQEHVDNDLIYWGQDGTSTSPRLKRFLSEAKDIVPRTVWTYDKVGHTQEATSELRSIFPDRGFSNPKPVRLMEHILRIGSGEGETVLDFFAGSGTLGHAVLNLTRQGEGKRQYILVEMGEYFDTLLRPRLMKTAFASEWKEGVPQNRDGQSHMLKYQRLESYEDALNNIELSQPGRTQMDLYEEFDDYLLRYMLDVELRGSSSLLSEETFEHPFGYRLKIQQGLESPEPTEVDLVETFHFLLGLKVETRRVKKHQNRRYVITRGRRETEDGYVRVVTIWRDREGLDLEEEAEWSERLWDDEPPGRVYINGPSYIPDAQPLEIPFREAMMEVDRGA